jgi:GNAT superfamily N-acetyltransferase
MQLIETTTLSTEQKLSIYQLWNREYPARLSHKDVSDFERYLNSLQDWQHYLLWSDSNKFDGWAGTFKREGETWFTLIVDSNVKGKGKGTWLLNRLKEKHQRLCGWVVDHNTYQKLDRTIYHTPLGFYLKNGFTLLSNVRLQNEKLTAVKIVWQSASNGNEKNLPE